MSYWIEYTDYKGKPLDKRKDAHTDRINVVRGKAVRTVGMKAVAWIFLSKTSRFPIGFVTFDEDRGDYIWSDAKTRSAYFVNSEGVIRKI